jgi:hypothetical protein
MKPNLTQGDTLLRLELDISHQVGRRRSILRGTDQSNMDQNVTRNVAAVHHWPVWTPSSESGSVLGLIPGDIKHRWCCHF